MQNLSQDLIDNTITLRVTVAIFTVVIAYISIQQSV